MKNIAKSLVIISILYPAFLFTQTVIPGGDVSGTWTKENSPYLIEGEITIPEGSQLTIETGVFIEFQGHYKFIVKGSILANGEINDTITFTINDTTGFHNISIPDGGWHGLRFVGNYTSDTSQLNFCKLQYGKAIGDGYYDKTGGAIFSSSYGSLTNHVQISNCWFQNNTAEYGGDAIFINSDYFSLNNCNISNNSGGNTIYCVGCYNIFIYNNTIVNNSGRAISGDRYHAEIINNVISNNTGGGIAFYCTFGGLIANNTICNNTTNDAGGGIKIESNYSDIFLYNNIFYGNSANSGDQISFSISYGDINFLYYNDIEGGFENIAGNGFITEYENNIDTDPFFKMANPYDFSLQETSPCINSGTPDTTGLNLPDYDIVGDPRIYNNSIVDMGAYEFQGEPTLLPEIGIINPPFNFGAVKFNQKSKEYPLLLSNYGKAPLEVNIISPNGFWIKPEGDTIFVQEIASLIINPENDTLLQVVFLPTDTLLHIDSLLITANDLDNPVNFISLTGTGTNEFILEGTISNDSTICADKILINNNVFIEPGAKLSICAGTEIEFLKNYSFSISGILEALGETGDSISFQITADSSFIIDSIPEYWGGLLFANSTSEDSSRLTHCIIQNIYNSINGAIYLDHYSNLSITNSYIKNNNYNATPIEDSIFGISCYHSSPFIKDCIIENNGKGGIYCKNYSSPVIVNSIITNHTGYGIYCKSHSSPSIIKNTITANTKSGVFLISSSSIIIANNISNNGYTGILLSDCYSSIISNNLIKENISTGNKGGIYFQSNDATILVNNNTIVQNKPSGVSIFDSSPFFQNNIIESNFYQISLVGNYCNSDFYYCNIEGGLESFNIGIYATYNGIYENNIDTDPMFLNTGDYPYMLLPSSPCVDAGNPDTLGMNLPVTDLAGNPRIYNNRVDIGAYEYGIYPPHFTSEPTVLTTVNEEYVYEISAADPTGNPLTFGSVTLPDWLTLNPSDTNFALLTGIPLPENLGENAVEITVSNSIYETSQSFNLKVTQVGIEKYPVRYFKISPNPSHGIFYIEAYKSITLPYKAKLLSYTGDYLKTYVINNSKFIINATDFPKGIFLLEISFDNKKVYKKIIIQ